eukprot:SAG31_NODE_36986_length_308_cov_0.985646_1_plen_64_part_00
MLAARAATKHLYRTLRLAAVAAKCHEVALDAWAAASTAVVAEAAIEFATAGANRVLLGFAERF